MVKTYAYGFPRIGKNREYKKYTEDFWKGKINHRELNQEYSISESKLEKTYDRNGIDWNPMYEFSPYDKMLDTAIMLNVHQVSSADHYYELCRGKNALEMTKWFNTNYHYLVSDFTEYNFDEFKFRLRKNFNKQKYPDNIYLIGPFTFLKLSKGIPEDKFEEVLYKAAEVYRFLIKDFDNVHIDEPAFVMDLDKNEIRAIKNAYNIMSKSNTNINLFTYYDDVDWLEDFLSLPVNGIGLDFVNGKNNLENIMNIDSSYLENKTLFAGFVDGTNVWRTNIRQVCNDLDSLEKITKDLYVTNAGPLYHLPVTLEGENNIPEELKSHLSFATEKLTELVDIQNKDFAKYSKYVGKPNKLVSDRVSSLKDDDFVKSLDVVERRKLQDEILNLPELPTTTIGSFPQTKEVRVNRLHHKKGKISTEEYNSKVDDFVKDAIKFQEDLGFDVLVHGESERSDMVEHFCQRLDGMSSTDNGWIISYGTRCYRPSIIHGDVSRPDPMTIREIEYAQSLTDKPVKGMLTGAVTIMAWDFVRKDIPIQDVSYQIALSLQDEIRDYEKAGIKMVQVDEPAFRELVPIKSKNHKEYFDWAIKSYNLSVNTNPRTQIHCHMCYSEFNEIVNEINQLDYDVVSIECSRSGGEIIEAFENIDFKRQIGLGVWDIHSPAIPTKDDMVKVLKRALRVIPRSQFWINPDCGLKTRGWEETKSSMENMVEAREEMINE